MAIITDLAAARKVLYDAADRGASVAIFCTASHWNTEAILLAAQRFRRAHNLPTVPVAVAMTFNYPHMPQAQRVLYARDAAAGFLSNMAHLRALCEGPDAPYADVTVLPHLDHANPERDHWALTQALPHLASVMFDAQDYPLEENIQRTAEYVRTYGSQVLVEGAMEGLSVSGAKHSHPTDDYVDTALDYVRRTGVDLLVADLGTEQQSGTVGQARYRRDRAQALTRAMGQKMLVLHGTSCLDDAQINGLSEDGIVRVNMWTRIAREAGQYAAQRLVDRMDRIRAGSFEDTESMAYLYDSIERAADIMEQTLGLLGYGSLTE
jgi:fructose/tagatose bisphosphate aldolase